MGMGTESTLCVGLRASHLVEHGRWILGQCVSPPCDALIWPNQDEIAFIDPPRKGVAKIDHVQRQVTLGGC